MKKLLLCTIVVLSLFSLVKAQTPLIKIDAQKDVFYDGLTGPDDGKLFIPARSFLSDVHNIPPSGGNADCSGILWTCWEYPYLYYYAEIKDNIVLCNNATGSGSKWSNDKLEIKYDPDPTQPDISAGVIQVGLSALDSTDATALAAVDNLHQDNELQLPDGTKWVPTRSDFARRRTSDGYVLEFRINMDYINKGTRNLPLPEVGLSFGTAINIADNDSVARTDMLQWSAGHLDLAWSWPRLQGKITLLGGNMVKYEAVSPWGQLHDSTIVNDSASVWYSGALGPVSGVESTHNKIPTAFTLEQNYPNPFNPTTTIQFTLPQRSDVRLVLVNVLGQVMKEIVNGNYSAGSHQVTLDASQLASGIYFYKLQAGVLNETKKLVLMK